MSRGSRNIERHLKTYCLKHDAIFEKEKRGHFGLRYDFALTLQNDISVMIEFDGKQHEKGNDHFFKSNEAIIKYRNNDETRNYLNRTGKINLIRIDDEHLPYSKFSNLISSFL